MRMANCHPDRKYHAKGMCYPCYLSAWKASRPRKSRAPYKLSPAQRERVNARRRSSYLVRQYGITESERTAIIEAQGGVCPICERTPMKRGAFGSKLGFHIDHDHETGRIRGILCNDCNIGLGLFRDDPSILDRASRYLMVAEMPGWREYEGSGWPNTAIPQRNLAEDFD